MVDVNSQHVESNSVRTGDTFCVRVQWGKLERNLIKLNDIYSAVQLLKLLFNDVTTQ